MAVEIEYQHVLALVLEALKEHPGGQQASLAQAVVLLASKKGLIDDPGEGKRGPGYNRSIDQIHDFVHEALWECVVKGVVVPGRDRYNAKWPFYRLTERGRKIVDAGAPQPYDRDGFIDYFRRQVPGADEAVEGYFAEAVDAFNAGCYRASAVMLGVASEQLVLLLIDVMSSAITDGDKKAKFEKAVQSWQIHTRYRALKDRLDGMVEAKKLPTHHAETVKSELGGVFELLRRYRNASGHPNVPGAVDAETVFLNLRTFVEYARRVLALAEYLRESGADW